MVEGDEPPMDIEEPLLPLRGGNKRFIDVGGGNVKTVVMSFIVTLIVLSLMTFAGGVSFVTKGDFTANMADIVAILEQAKADVAKAKNEVASAIQGIPGTVATYANNAVAQATSQWNSQLSAVSDRVTSLANSVQADAGKIAELTTRQASDVETLNAKITELKTQLATAEVRIKTLEDKVITPTFSGIFSIDAYSNYYQLRRDISDSTNMTVSDDIIVEITNKSATTLEDVDVDIIIQIYGMTYDKGHSAVSLSGAIVRKLDSSWDGYDYNVEYKVTKRNISISPGKTRSIYLTLKVVRDIGRLPYTTERYDYDLDATPIEN